MVNGEKILIAKVGNGFMVERFGAPNSVQSYEEILVFNELGESLMPSDNALLNFIVNHFKDSQ